MEEKKKDELLAYFMGQTNERLVQIESKLTELIAFRAEVKAEAKNQATLVAIAVSIIMLIIQIAAKKYGLL